MHICVENPHNIHTGNIKFVSLFCLLCRTKAFGNLVISFAHLILLQREEKKNLPSRLCPQQKIFIASFIESLASFCHCLVKKKIWWESVWCDAVGKCAPFDYEKILISYVIHNRFFFIFPILLGVRFFLFFSLFTPHSVHSHKAMCYIQL